MLWKGHAWIVDHALMMGRVHRHMFCSHARSLCQDNCLQWNQGKLQIISRETCQIQARHLDMIGKSTWLFVIVCWIKTRPHTTFFPCTCSCVFNMWQLFFNFTSGRVSLITIENISDCNLYPSATTRLFAIRNGGSFSMSTGYVNL